MTNSLNVSMTSDLLDKVNEEAQKRNTTKNRIVAECIEKQLIVSKNVPEPKLQVIY